MGRWDLQLAWRWRDRSQVVIRYCQTTAVLWYSTTIILPIMSTSMPKEKQAPSGVSMKLALAADGDVADTLAAAAAAAAADEAGDEHPDPNQAASPNGPGGKRNSFSNPLDLLAGLASEHHDQEGSGTEEEPSGDLTQAAAKALEQNTTASAPKKKRKLLLPVKPVGAKVTDDFKVIHSAVGDVPAASSKDFAINNNDVLSGRGGLTNHHPGNILFRNLVKAKQADYVRASRHEKAYIARDIVGIMKKLDPPGRFLKKDPKDPNKWIEIDDKQARQKASQALREGAPKVRSQISAAAPTQQAQVMGATAVPNPALPIGPGAVPLVPPVPVANPALLVRGAATASVPVPVPFPAPGTVPPGSAPAVAAAGGNAVTPLTLSPASSTATAAPGAASGSKQPQASVASASEGEAKEQ